MMSMIDLLSQSPLWVVGRLFSGDTQELVLETP